MSEVTNVEYGLEKIFEGAKDFLPLLGTDYIEFYVGNAKQATHFYKSVFGFSIYAYSGPESGNRDYVSYVLKNNKIFFVITSSLKNDDSISKWVELHGDGVVDIAFSSDNVTKDYNYAIKNGALSHFDVQELKDEMEAENFFIN